MAPRALLAGALLLLGGLLLAADFGPQIARRFSGRPAATPVIGAAAIGRSLLATTCHQRAERCLVVDGARMSACARCVGLHAGGLLAGLLLLAGASFGGRWSRGILLASLLAMGVDVVTGIAWPMWDHPLLRTCTGVAVVVAAALTAAGRLAPPAEPSNSEMPALVAGATR